MLTTPTFRLPDRRIYGPVWEQIYDTLPRYLNTTCRDDMYSDAFYVRERVGQGVTEKDVVGFVYRDSTAPLLIVGPAGIGKTTFIHHALQDARLHSQLLTVWIDVFDEVYDPDAPTRMIGRLVDRTASKIVEGIASLGLEGHSSEEWLRFFVRNCPDPIGESAILRRQLELMPELAAPQQNAVFEGVRRLLDDFRSRPMDLLRLRLIYLREKGYTPVLVLDNADRIPLASQKSLLHLAWSLAAANNDDRPTPSHIVTILAMRPESIGASSPSEGVGLFPVGRLREVKAHAVFERRLACFLSNLEPSDTKKFRRDVDRFLDPGDSRALLSSNHALHELAKDLIKDAADLLERDDLDERIHLMSNYNLRVAMHGIAGFIASGHHPWKDLIRHSVGLTQDKPHISHRSAYRALLLGTRSVFSTRSCWACNLFNDLNPGGLDECSSLVRARALIWFEGREGASLDIACESLRSLFRYPDDRVKTTLQLLLVRGMIDEIKDGSYGLTDMGDRYLAEMENFEYLQHVTMDAPVSEKWIVRCSNADGERAWIRADRVAKFASYVDEIEKRDLEALGKVRVGNGDSKCFSIARRIATALLSAIDRLPRGEHGDKLDRIKRAADRLTRPR